MMIRSNLFPFSDTLHLFQSIASVTSGRRKERERYPRAASNGSRCLAGLYPFFLYTAWVSDLFSFGANRSLDDTILFQPGVLVCGRFSSPSPWSVAAIMIYNGLVKMRVQVDGAWADIDVQLETPPRSHSQHRGNGERVRRAREGHSRSRGQCPVGGHGGPGPGQTGPGGKHADRALKSLFALSEAYPDLKAADNFKDLQQTLKELETGIQQARRYYNAVVRDYNTKIGQVPSNLVAKAFNFSSREFFEIDEGEGEVPTVSFD